MVSDEVGGVGGARGSYQGEEVSSTMSAKAAERSKKYSAATDLTSNATGSISA